MHSRQKLLLESPQQRVASVLSSSSSLVSSLLSSSSPSFSSWSLLTLSSSCVITSLSSFSLSSCLCQSASCSTSVCCAFWGNSSILFSKLELRTNVGSWQEKAFYYHSSVKGYLKIRPKVPNFCLLDFFYSHVGKYCKVFWRTGFLISYQLINDEAIYVIVLCIGSKRTSQTTRNQLSLHILDRFANHPYILYCSGPDIAIDQPGLYFSKLGHYVLAHNCFGALMVTMF